MCKTSMFIQNDRPGPEGERGHSQLNVINPITVLTAAIAFLSKNYKQPKESSTLGLVIA